VAPTVPRKESALQLALRPSQHHSAAAVLWLLQAASLKAVPLPDLFAMLVWPRPLAASLAPSTRRLMCGRRAMLHVGALGGWIGAALAAVALFPPALLAIAVGGAAGEWYWRRRSEPQWGRRLGLPPGRLLPFDPERVGTPGFHRRRAAEHGPVFKYSPGLLRPEFCTTDLTLARRLLDSQDASLRQVHRAFAELVPKGVLRCMEGEDHRRYRALFNNVFRADPVSVHASLLRQVITDGLAQAAASGEQRVEHPGLGRILSALSARIVLLLAFGVLPGTTKQEWLQERFAGLWPEGQPTNARRPDAETYRDVLGALRDRLADAPANPERPGSYLEALVVAGGGAVPDETALGNLVYMARDGILDLVGLMLWMLHFAARSGSYIYATRPCEPSQRQARGDAFARETLRLAQSEFIRRRTAAPVELGGFRIPPGYDIVISLRGAHGDPERFADPEQFDPDRHLEGRLSPSRYAPFGLGKHACPAAAMVLSVAGLFVEELAANWRIEMTSPGAPTRWGTHWEPGGRIAFAPIEAPPAPLRACPFATT
jgi:cytochrome P450